MRLYVYLLEGKYWAVEDSYVKLKIGKFKSKTRVLKNTRNPIWNEEFVFRVHDLEDELVLSVYQHHDHSGIFNNVYGDLVGKLKIPVSSVASEENHNLPPTWFSLQKPKSAKSVDKYCGKILLTVSLHGKGNDLSGNHVGYVNPINDTSKEIEVTSISSQDFHGFAPHSKKISEGKHLMKNIACHFEKLFSKNEDTKKSDEDESKKEDSSDMSTITSDYEESLEDPPVSHSFEEVVERMRPTSEDKEMPGDLQGGVLLDQTYVVSSKDLNMLLFSPGSQFRKDLAELQGTTDVQEGPWTWKSDDMCVTRVVTYIKAASKLVKAVQATEQQTYTKADGKEFSVYVSVNTPDVPYGSTFKVELLYKIMPGQQQPSGEESARLVVSWAINFCQNTVMKSMIEGGARQGLKGSFDQFAEVLARKLKVTTSKFLNLQSPHKNSTFQKIFGLPPEEFLINDYSCSLKRKMPLQGRIFLSARIVGFYANLFGHKTKLFFLWEDIEDINVVSPSWSTMGSPALVIILRKGRGIDARHGAKCQDEEGRLHFCFHSFVSFNVASRTIMALWRTRTLPLDQKERIVEEQQENDEKLALSEDAASYLIVEDVQMSKVYSSELPVNVKSLMRMFDEGDLEYRVMSKSGCLNYATTSWETVAPDVSERQVSYKFNRFISVFGGEVTSTQQKSSIARGAGWIINEIMALRDVPFGDYFRVQFRYEIESSSSVHNSCKCDVSVGVMWLKMTKFEQRITRNIVGKFTARVKDILELVEREILLSC
ncbi:unnamed protein product [Withania somnifera]